MYRDYAQEQSFIDKIQDDVSDLINDGRRGYIEVKSVGLDGWLLSSRRSGTALVVNTKGVHVPVEFIVIGNR